MSSKLKLILLFVVAGTLLGGFSTYAQEKTIYVYAFRTGNFDGKKNVAITPIYTDQDIIQLPGTCMFLTNSGIS